MTVDEVSGGAYTFDGGTQIQMYSIGSPGSISVSTVTYQSNFNGGFISSI